MSLSMMISVQGRFWIRNHVTDERIKVYMKSQGTLTITIIVLPGEVLFLISLNLRQILLLECTYNCT